MLTADTDLPRLTMSVTWRKFMRTVNLLQMITNYGKTWRVPCKLLYGKECYMVISEMKDDFYKEF